MGPLERDSPLVPDLSGPVAICSSGPVVEGLTRTVRDLYYRRLAREIVRRRGVNAKDRSEDRRVLEQFIIPLVLSRFEPRRVLDIGREAYESFYNEFFTGRELWTIDRDASKRPFGAANHIIDDVTNLRTHFPEPHFDFVLMNGVFGWGLNRAEDIERAFAAIHAVLRPHGLLILGWNDTPDLTPVPLAQVQALHKFSPHFLEPLNGASLKCAVYEHTYSFYTPRSEFRLQAGVTGPPAQPAPFHDLGISKAGRTVLTRVNAEVRTAGLRTGRGLHGRAAANQRDVRSTGSGRRDYCIGNLSQR